MEKILILGGTKFIGRSLVEALIQLGKYELTLFNRGITNPHLFPEVNKIVGDRRSPDIKKIAATHWDYVIDVSSYYPNPLIETLKVVNKDVKRYIYISSVSVYDFPKGRSATMHDEDTPLLACTEMQGKDDTWSTYGQRKAECDRLIQQSDLDYMILRPALVYGAYDHTDRFYYWLYQVEKGKTILRPEQHDTLFSYTYVKDLVIAIIEALTLESETRIYNLVSHPKISIGQIIKTAMSILNINPKIVDAPNSFYEKKVVKAFSDIPLWLPDDRRTYDNKRMLQHFDFQVVDFGKSVKDTIAYYKNNRWPLPVYGISEERKFELIRELIK